MAYILQDPSIFGITLNLAQIYYLSVGREIADKDYPTIKWAISNNIVDNQFTKAAAEAGNIDCLIYLHEEGCVWDRETCEAAAFNGQLNCLKYLHEQGCPWDVETCRYAVSNGHLDCLKYAIEKGCGWDRYICRCATDPHIRSYLQEIGLCG